MADNLETIRSLYEAFARGDVPAVLARLDTDVSWTEAEGFPYAGTYKGHEAVLQNVFMRLGTEWDGFAAIPHEFIVQGDTVVSLGQYSGTYRNTGKSFSAPFAHVWRLRNGKVTKYSQYTDTAVVQNALR